MKILNVQGTISTPEIIVNDSQFLINGETRPENPKKFYEPVFLALDQIKEGLNKSLLKEFQFTFDFEYISTSSLVMIKKLLIEIYSLKKDYSFINVQWKYYEMDEDMQMLGEELSEITGLEMDIKIRN